MKTLAYFTLLVWFLLIAINFSFANNSNDIFYREIYDIFHKQKYTINIREDLGKGRVILNLLENKKVIDNLTIIHVQGVKKSETIADTFLLLTFPVRGGTGIGIYITKIFSVKGGKLFENLVLKTTYREDQKFLGKTLIQRYNVFFILQGSSYRDFALHVNESNYLDDKTKDPRRQEDWKKVFTIPFDHEEMIFTNGTASLNGEFFLIVFKTNLEEEKCQFKNKIVKKLFLEKQKWFHINNKWYAIGENERTLTRMWGD